MAGLIDNAILQANRAIELGADPEDVMSLLPPALQRQFSPKYSTPIKGRGDIPVGAEFSSDLVNAPSTSKKLGEYLPSMPRWNPVTGFFGGDDDPTKVTIDPALTKEGLLPPFRSDTDSLSGVTQWLSDKFSEGSDASNKEQKNRKQLDNSGNTPLDRVTGAITGKATDVMANASGLTNLEENLLSDDELKFAVPTSYTPFQELVANKTGEEPPPPAEAQEESQNILKAEAERGMEPELLKDPEARSAWDKFTGEFDLLTLGMALLASNDGSSNLASNVGNSLMLSRKAAQMYKDTAKEDAAAGRKEDREEREVLAKEGELNRRIRADATGSTGLGPLDTSVNTMRAVLESDPASADSIEMETEGGRKAASERAATHLEKLMILNGRLRVDERLTQKQLIEKAKQAYHAEMNRTNQRNSFGLSPSTYQPL